MQAEHRTIPRPLFAPTLPEGMPSDSQEVETLARDRAQSGDLATATALLLRVHLSTVHRFCSDWTGGSSATEELSRAVFLRAHQALANFRFDVPARAWLLRIARNVCLEHDDRVTVTGRFFPREGREGEDLAPPPPGILVMDRDAVSRMEESLDLISDEDRALLLVRHRDGVTESELVVILGEDAPGVQRRLHRALSRVMRPLARAHASSSTGPRCSHSIAMALASESGDCPTCAVWRSVSAEVQAIMAGVKRPPDPGTELLSRTVEAVASAELHPDQEKVLLQAVARQVRDRSLGAKRSSGASPLAGSPLASRRRHPLSKWLSSPLGVALAAAVGGILVVCGVLVVLRVLLH